MASGVRRLSRPLQRAFSLWCLLAAATLAVALKDGEYFRPLPPQGSGRVGTMAPYSRSPCPAINALANHGFISRDGKAITAQALKDAVMEHFNVDNRYADTLVALAKKPVFNLDELSVHNMVEHDMSLVHKDAFFGEDPGVADPDLIADLFGHVGASGVLDPWFFARTQQRRLRDCMNKNPQCEFSNEFLLSVTLGRQGLLMRVMGGKNEEAVGVEAAKMLLVEEKLSPSWKKSTKPISQDDIQATRVRLFALLKASGEWLGDGIGTTNQQLISDAYPSLCLQSENKTLVLVKCDARLSSQKFLLDANQRFTIANGGCVQVEAESNTTGAQIVEAVCSDELKLTHQWRYDASGRLRPVHAPDLCIDIDPSSAPPSKIVTASCSARSQQRFYSFYANFQPSVSRIASIDAPQSCLGLETSAATSSALDLSPVVVDACDSLDEGQELTLDESKRLVFSYDQTQCMDVDSGFVVQKPCSTTSSQWFYDSLSRLHPSTNTSQCLLLSSKGNSTVKVSLADCADGLAQKWFITDTKNADIRPADQYYRPNVFESSGKPGTSASFSRSPCPALNTLANHGYLPRSGRNLTAAQVKKAVVDYFNIDPTYAQVLVELAKKEVFDLDDLSVHNAAEHDMSLVHADAFFGQDPAVTDPTLIAELLRHVGSSGTMDVLFFARTQARRLAICQSRNPQCDFSNEYLMSVAIGRLGLLMRGMGGQNQNLVHLDTARSFLVDERFPEDFQKSPTPITQANIQDTRVQIYSLLKSSGEWLVDGFLRSNKGTQVISEGGNHTLCLAVQQGLTDANASLMVTSCSENADNQRLLMDDYQRIVVEKSGLCLGAVDYGTRPGTPIAQQDCSDEASNQIWTYDSSGRLRPAHAANLCMFASAEDPAMKLTECDASRDQQFYSIYDGFKPNASHLNSIEFSDLCVSIEGGSAREGASVIAESCEPLSIEQQLTLDNKDRLIFQHSSLCLTATATNLVIQSACKDSPNQAWQYDSLGRLHLSRKQLCLELSNNSSAASLFVADCSDRGVQRWFASDANDPNKRPQNTYYRPNREESSGRTGNSATYSRSPCPALNALANHGIISRDGRNVSRFDLIGAVIATYNIEESLADQLMMNVSSDFVNLDQFSDPTVFDFKGSLLHSDAFFSPDPAAIDPDFVSDLFAYTGSDMKLDLVYFSAAIRRRLDAYAREYGTPTMTTSARSSKYLKTALLLRVMSDGNQEGLDVDVVRQLLVEERIPDGYVKPSQSVTTNDVHVSTTKVQAMVETGSTSTSGPGGTSEWWLSKPFHPKKEPIFALTNDSVSCLNLADGALTLETCDASKLSQLFTYDDQQRLIVEASGSCLDVIDGKLGSDATLGHVDCTNWPHQKWTYDASGRLHPQHALKFCLGVALGASGGIDKCDDRSEQLFFASFSGLALNNKQLVSVADADESKELQGQLTHCLSVTDSATLSLEQCSETNSRQLFSSDDSQHLIAQGSNKCAAITKGPTNAQTSSVSETDCLADAATQQWTYDSVGRLHPTSAMGLCLTADKAAGAAVKLDVCSTSDAQRWIVVKLTIRSESPSIGGGGPTESAAKAASMGFVVLLVLVLHVFLGV